MGSIGPVQLIIIAIVILVLFGRGKISEMMGDFGKGVKSFKDGMVEGQETPSEGAVKAQQSRIEGPQHEAKPAADAAADPKPSADKSDA